MCSIIFDDFLRRQASELVGAADLDLVLQKPYELRAQRQRGDHGAVLPVCARVLDGRLQFVEQALDRNPGSRHRWPHDFVDAVIDLTLAPQTRGTGLGGVALALVAALLVAVGQ